jgi:translation initiation factor 5A
MSDDEHHDVHFESADAGASKTFPMQAGSIRKNGHIVIKNRPCKVVDVSTSKTGKHGHAKCHFVAVDIFTNKKVEDLTPSSHNCDVPHVSRTEYTLIDISDDGFCSLMLESGETKDDLTLPSGTDELDKLAIQIKADFDEGKELIVAVLSVSYSYFIQLRSSKIISLIFLTLVTGGGGGGSFFSIESKLEKMAGMIYF